MPVTLRWPLTQALLLNFGGFLFDLLQGCNDLHILSKASKLKQESLYLSKAFEQNMANERKGERGPSTVNGLQDGAFYVGKRMEQLLLS